MSENSGKGTTKKSLLGLLAALVLGLAYYGLNPSGGEETAADKTAADTTVNGFVQAVAPNYEKVRLGQGVSNQLITYKGYQCYFNPKQHIPNCVVYELTRSEASGRNLRDGEFAADPNVKASPEVWHYSSTGYDRGHMAPAGDFRWDEQAMHESFYMTNMCPQNHYMNSHPWNDLEQRVRQWAKRDGALIVVSGPIVDPKGKVINKKDRYGNKDMVIPIPTHFYKIVLSHKKSPMRAIAFLMPNKEFDLKPVRGLDEYAVSVDRIEELTGFDFFSALADDVEEKIESSPNIRLWD
ncbi:MAG: DNA/RNA non-specific endonuclease [Bacteroidaceae bacterium]|nr:DNA/RNA non-specific endonuclease [Bacteroidaceae bacterium]